MGNACGPVAERASRITTSKVSGHIGSQTARVRDVFARKPDGISIHRGGPIVSPARANRIHLREVAGETVLRGRSLRGNVYVARADFSIQRSIAGARKMIRAQHGKGNHAASAGIDAY